MDHPEYLKNPLYVAGESYAGIYIALVTRKIYDGIVSCNIYVNLVYMLSRAFSL